MRGAARPYHSERVPMPRRRWVPLDNRGAAAFDSDLIGRSSIRYMLMDVPFHHTCTGGAAWIRSTDEEPPQQPQPPRASLTSIDSPTTGTAIMTPRRRARLPPAPAAASLLPLLLLLPLLVRGFVPPPPPPVALARTRAAAAIGDRCVRDGRWTDGRMDCSMRAGAHKGRRAGPLMRAMLIGPMPHQQPQQ